MYKCVLWFTFAFECMKTCPFSCVCVHTSISGHSAFSCPYNVQRAHAHTSHTGCVCALRSLGHGCVQEVKNDINTVRFLTQTARFVS